MAMPGKASAQCLVCSKPSENVTHWLLGTITTGIAEGRAETQVLSLS